jgi:hypothetical protein
VNRGSVAEARIRRRVPFTSIELRSQRSNRTLPRPTPRTQGGSKGGINGGQSNLAIDSLTSRGGALPCVIRGDDGSTRGPERRGKSSRRVLCPQAHGERMRIWASFSPFLLKSTPEKTTRMSQQTGSKTTLTVGPARQPQRPAHAVRGKDLGHAVGFPPVGRNETRGPFRLAFVLFFSSFFSIPFSSYYFFIYFSNPNMDSNFNSNLVTRQLLHSIFV